MEAPPATRVRILSFYGSVLRNLYLIPNSFPTLERLPLLVVGMPVAFAIFLFAFVIPRALLGLKDNPGMSDFFLFAITISSLFETVTTGSISLTF